MTVIDVPSEFAEMHDREWKRLAEPGTWFTGSERVAIAAAARGSGGTTPAERAARVIHDEPATITRDWLGNLEAAGLTLLEYVEVIGIVARLRSVDTTRFGLGHSPRSLPQPVDGQPTRETTEAQLDGSWIPTLGVAFPPTILSAVPAENEAMFDVHGTLYLAPSQEPEGNSMGNMAVVRDGLDRAQMEFVAARTSLLNDCFF